MKKAGRYFLTVVPVFVGLLIQILCGFAGYREVIIYILIISQLLTLLLFGVWYVQQNKGRVHRKINQIIHGKTLGWIFFLGIGLQLLTSLALSSAYLFVPEAIENLDHLMKTAGIGEANVWVLLSTVILAPVVEEITFRGVTFNLAKKAGASFTVANLIQAVLFGIYHFNLVQGVYVCILGLVLGYVVWKYDSLYPAVLLHLMYNLAAIVLSAVSEKIPGTVGSYTGMIVLGVAATTMALWIFRTDKKNTTEMVNKNACER